MALSLDGGSERIRLGRLDAVGALVGVAMLYKYQAAVQLPLYALHLAWCARRQPSRVVAGAAALCAGLAAALLGAVGVMHVLGAWQSAWFWFRFNFAYIKEGLRPAELAARAAKRVSYVVLPAAFIWAMVSGRVAPMRASFPA